MPEAITPSGDLSYVLKACLGIRYRADLRAPIAAFSRSWAWLARSAVVAAHSFREDSHFGSL